MSIEYINVNINKTCDNYNIELSFKNIGKIQPIFIENATAFLFRKLVYRLKCHLEETNIDINSEFD